MRSGRKHKIFGIGLSRTGTNSLYLAMQRFAFVSCHYPPPEPLLAGDYNSLDQWDFCNDIPVSLYFRELDEFFPNSRFILTTREKESWLRSCATRFYQENMEKKWAGTPQETIFTRMYGGHTFYDRQAFGDAYDNHVQNVLSYFKDRPDDLMVLAVEEAPEAKKQKLATFLDQPVFEGGFPVSHQTDYAKEDRLP